MRKIIITAVLLVFINPVLMIVYGQYLVRSFCANGDGVTLDTRSIQNAIDKAFENGGGPVEVSPGTYKIGTLILKDNIELHMQPGAIILGSPDAEFKSQMQRLLVE